MKIFIFTLIITVMSMASALAQSSSRCGGSCIGTSNNTYYNNACAAASVNGEKACQNYSGLGCVWEPRRLMPGKCVGTGGNPYYDNACIAASVNGQKACENYSGLGCVWEPAYCL